ncbi:Thioredoxin domain-containing protein 12 [Dirofilaria immitis]|nr:Thioredoxin domain-containing protein 12 [Dirofilaria immitis]
MGRRHVETFVVLPLSSHGIHHSFYYNYSLLHGMYGCVVSIAFGIIILLLSSSNIDASFDTKQIYQNPLSHGFGEDIDWVKWEDAVEMAMEVNKPIFLLIHKSWCHACKALKKTFQQSNARKAFKQLSKYFIMVNTEDDEEPYEEEYRPDGKYIPRVLFLDKNGDLLPQFKNKKAEYKDYAYYYSSPADVLNSMKDVMRYYNIDVPEMKKGQKLKPNKSMDDEDKNRKRRDYNQKYEK